MKRAGEHSERCTSWPIAIGLICSVLVIGCAPESDVAPESAESSQPSQGVAPSSQPPTDGTGTPSTVPEKTDPAVAATPEPAMPGGLEVARGTTSDPNLAAEAPSGRATARWGERGPSTEGSSPWRGLAYDGIHDGDAISILQEPRSALRSLPREGAGNYVDWVAALRTGAIRPRARVGGQGSMETLDQDILMTDTKNMPYVTFPHLAHTEWLSCRNCHDWLFKAQIGANDFSMTDIARGRACGLCHGKVAFPATECFRCHDGPRPGG